MAAADTMRKCRECGEAHNFFLVDGDVFEGNTIYQYKCPKTHKMGRIRASAIFGSTVFVRPANTVVVNRVRS